MTTIRYLLYGVGLIALQGCSSAAVTEDVAESQAAATQGSANLTITSSSNNQYCANLTLVNGLATATTKWQVLLDLSTSVITGSWSGTFSGTTGQITVTPVSYNSSVSPGSSATFGWCASIPNSTVRPTLRAWNFEMNVYQTCQSNNGVNPTKAALAVAMAMELGRWKPNLDLVQTGNNQVGLSPTGLAQCKNGCPNTKGLLGQATATSEMTSNVFDPANYGSELVSGFGRQSSNYQNIVQNYPSQIPPEHKLTYVAGPVNMGVGACGPHYLFQVDNLDGTPMTTKQAANMANWLCFYGMNGTNGYGCGSNPYLGFFQTSNGCPSGRSCIAIDPTDGDNGTISTTSSGSAVTYPMNRAYDPTSSLLGSPCITTLGRLGTMTSRCAGYPNTCGYDYCLAN
jgi:hypothetical protein